MSGGYPQPVSSDDRTWGMLAHLGALAGFVLGVGFLGWVVPLIIWLLKRNQSQFVAFHALEELFFQLVWLVIPILAAIVFIASCVGIVLLPLLIPLAFIPIIWPIIAALKANAGEWYQYPVVGQWALRNLGY